MGDTGEVRPQTQCVSWDSWRPSRTEWCDVAAVPCGQRRTNGPPEGQRQSGKIDRVTRVTSASRPITYSSTRTCLASTLLRSDDIGVDRHASDPLPQPSTFLNSVTLSTPSPALSPTPHSLPSQRLSPHAKWI